ncbi:phosphotransferase [Paenibacillus solani]|uniref:Aminoglycoside phosphotransferase n=1 Tax=Paenibacillus solani TaxID=1705565 RepID=A0A0M1P4D4_9BACL|nr:phosphotransferase [Paenibacillus solani]KOR88889.1 aminoglycoside phosphotransferase [Paenibacillus solani]
MIQQLLQAYWPDWTGDTVEGPSGWNNTTRFIYNSQRRSVMRIYNTHRDKSRIEFEFAVLDSLQSMSLSFKIPTPIPATLGEKAVQIQDGSDRYACLFAYIEGARPEEDDIQAAYSFGEKTGELVHALAKCSVEEEPVYPPYFELLQSYPSCSKAFILDFCKQPPIEFQEQRAALLTLQEAYIDICSRLDSIKSLPQQLVHGDLNFSNLLVDSENMNTVTALLDFEFCTRDVRAMEPAVVISGFLGIRDEREAIRQFCEGFASTVRLSKEEIIAIPVLMRLRLVDVFLHFFSRYREGTDEFHILKEQVNMLANGFKSLEQSQEWMEDLLFQTLL